MNRVLLRNSSEQASGLASALWHARFGAERAHMCAARHTLVPCVFVHSQEPEVLADAVFLSTVSCVRALQDQLEADGHQPGCWVRHLHAEVRRWAAYATINDCEQSSAVMRMLP